MEQTQQGETGKSSVSVAGRGNRVTATVVNTGQSHPFSLPVQPGVSVFRGTAASLQPLTKAPQHYSAVNSAATVQPLSHKGQVLGRVLLKAVHKGSTGKNDGKVFSLRNVNTSLVSSCEALKTLIKDQLSGDIGAIEDFDVGFLEGANLVRMRNHKDLEEAWDMLKSNSKVTLWCDGLIVERSGKKGRKRSPDDADEASTKTKKKKVQERENKVEEIFDKLKEAHSNNFTTMQLHIWAEMVNSGLHRSMDEAPNTSMFQRAGGGSTPSRKKDLSTPVTQQMQQLL